jgi:hypothetical protein
MVFAYRKSQFILQGHGMKIFGIIYGLECRTSKNLATLIGEPSVRGG